MNMNKKFLSLTLAFVMILGSLASLTPVLAAETAVGFTDVKEGEWFFEHVNTAVENKLVEGYKDGTFRPNNELTRAEMVTILARAFELEDKASLDKFIDVKGHWAVEAFAQAVEAGIFIGDGNKLMPDANITREQAFATVARGLNLEAEELKVDFPDADEISSWFVKDGEVAALINLGFIEGNEKGMLEPTKTITRAEMVKIMNAALEYEPKEEETPSELTVKSVSAINATTLDVTLSDDTVHEVELDKALEPNVETEVTFEIDGNEYTATVTWVVAEDTEFPAEPDVAGMEEELKDLQAEKTQLEKDYAEADSDASYYHAIYEAEKAKGNKTAADIAKANRDEAIAARDAANEAIVKINPEISNKMEEIRVAKLEVEAIKAVKKAAETNKWTDYETADTLANNLPGKSKVKSDLQEINKKTESVLIALDKVETQMGYLPELKDVDSTNKTQKANITNAKKAINDAKALKPTLDLSKEETQIKKLETAMDNHAEKFKENNATAKVENAEAWLNKDSVTNAQVNHDDAVKLVNDLKDGKVKTDLTARLMEVQKGIDEIKADRAAAADVDKMINDLTPADGIYSTNLEEVKVEVAKVRTAYEALTQKQKDLVKSLEALKTREAKIKQLEDDIKANKEAAKKVDELIAALPDKDTKYVNLTVGQITAIYTARDNYNALTEVQKGLVNKDNVTKMNTLVATADAE